MERGTNPKEIWKPIAGYEGLYEVSNFGNVASLNYRQTGNRVVLKLNKLKAGYSLAHLSKGGEEKAFLVHRLVAEAFIPNPNNDKYVNHKDEDKGNNNAYNLEWCSHKYNDNYGTRNERLSAIHTNSERMSMPVIATLPDGTEEYYPSMMEVGRVLQKKSAHTHVSQAVKGIRKTAYKRTWRLAEREEIKC